MGFELISLQRPLPGHPISGLYLLANVEDLAYAAANPAFVPASASNGGCKMQIGAD